MHLKTPRRQSIGFLLITSLFIISGCTCNGDKNKKATADSLLALHADSMHVDSLAREDSRRRGQFEFDSLTTNWLSAALGGRAIDTSDFTTGQAPGVETDSVKAGQDPAIGQFGDSATFTPSVTFYENYAQVLRWNPDSSYLLDMGSYGSIPVKGRDGKIRLEGGEPDTKVVLIDPQKHVQWQILFGGPGLRILDGKWKDKNHFMLLYTHDAARQSDTLLMTGNMQTHQLHWYGLNRQ